MTQPTTNLNNILKDTRESKGLTLEIVHEATKIPLDALKAIEQGYSTKILTPFYYKGFIKIYAEFLGLNVEEVLKEYHLEKKAPVPVTQVVAKKIVQPKRPIQVIEKPQNVITGLNSRKNRDFVARLIVVVVGILLLFFLFRWIMPHLKFNKSKRIEKVEAVEPVASDKSAQTKLPFKIIKAESNNLKVSLSVRAVKDSWIQVKVDGKVVYAMTISKGTMENWVAYNQIEVSGHNINELDLEVNGKHLGALGSNERGVKKAVINRQGLTVKK